MRTGKTKIAAQIFSLLLLWGSLSPFSLTADTSTLIPTTTDIAPSFSVDKDGNVTANQLKVMMIAGTTFYTRFYISDAFIRILLKTAPTARVARRFGDQIDLSQISVGDNLNVSGVAETGADTLSFIASSIIDTSIQKKDDSFKGVISGIATSTSSFTLTTSTGDITVNVGTTTQVKKGSRILDFAHLRLNDRVLDSTGTFDYPSRTLDAAVVSVYLDRRVFREQNFQGTFKAASTGTPPTLTVTIGGIDYSIIVSGDTPIQSKRRRATSIARFLSGDTVRIYGAIREADDPIIDAQIIRDLNL